MAILHMDTNQVDEQGRSLLRSATDMFDKVSDLRYSANRLKDNWQGSTAGHVTGELESLAGRMENAVNQLDEFSRRVIQESQQWLEMDQGQAGVLDGYKPDFSMSNPLDVFKTGVDVAAAVGLIANLGKSAARSNSLIMGGPNILRALVGIKEGTRVIKPETLAQNLSGKAGIVGMIGVAVDVIDVAATAWQTYHDPRYIGSSRALPAAAVDAIFKGAMIGVTSIAVGAAVGAAATIASPVIAGVAVIGLVVAGPILIDGLITNPAFNAWQKSHVRDQVIEWGARASDKVSDFARYQAHKGADTVKKAFNGFVKAIPKAIPKFW